MNGTAPSAPYLNQRAEGQPFAPGAAAAPARRGQNNVNGGSSLTSCCKIVCLAALAIAAAQKVYGDLASHTVTRSHPSVPDSVFGRAVVGNGQQTQTVQFPEEQRYHRAPVGNGYGSEAPYIPPTQAPSRERAPVGSGAQTPNNNNEGLRRRAPAGNDRAPVGQG